MSSYSDLRELTLGLPCARCGAGVGDGNRVPCHAGVLLELANPGWTP